MGKVSLTKLEISDFRPLMQFEMKLVVEEVIFTVKPI